MTERTYTETNPPRFENHRRNARLNKALRDIQNIVVNHDPEIDTPIEHGVWDRLDILVLEVEADLQAAVADALERAAEAAHGRLFPKNPTEDWTRYAEINAAAAIEVRNAIRALIPDDAAAALDRIRREAVEDLGPLGTLIPLAVTEAEKAMRKFPQPNYVISKWAEETGEVTKAAIHYAEGREPVENLCGEIVQSLAMLHRLIVEGDEVHGAKPFAAAIREGEETHTTGKRG